MHNENTRQFYICLKSLKLQTGILGKRLLFECPFEILKDLTNSSQCILFCGKNLAYVIRNLLSLSAATFRFEVFFTKKTLLHRCNFQKSYNPSTTQNILVKMCQNENMLLGISESSYRNAKRLNFEVLIQLNNNFMFLHKLAKLMLVVYQQTTIREFPTRLWQFSTSQ